MAAGNLDGSNEGENTKPDQNEVSYKHLLGNPEPGYSQR